MYQVIVRVFKMGKRNKGKSFPYTYGFYKTLWRANRKAFYLDNLAGLEAEVKGPWIRGKIEDST